ncbi:O-linked N-acetylglucosamine transferase, SPINDLY family protein [Leisingera sp. ANG-M6]|uniref:O-linked N-acetylglucosamine transferase, SPINDLY family protein n=1 Tax=Leisingera sp. ANG-M6 TaxID=1577900 RepID=UPI00057CCEDD|nr:tetratricopeptide repeat protein [Leisingera sp. ANG-M6]KIC24475.1 UDP-N-acetylglucosamine--peptide N-acetylglucosaminyltransferase subunit [Leisingera sp. ANG-M6]
MTPANSLSEAEQFERDAKFEDAAMAYAGILSRNPRNKRAQSALEGLRKRLDSQTDPSPVHQAGLEEALAEGRPFEAAESCGALLKTFRESHFLWDFLGRCHLAAGHLDNAATCLNKAIGINPRAAGSYAAMGRVKAARGELDNAMALYDKALMLAASCLQALHGKAEVLIKRGQSQKAAIMLRKAVALAPHDAALHVTLAGLLTQQGAVEDAKEHYNQAVRLNPALTEARYQLGLLLKAEGAFAAALPCFDKVLKANPSDDRARTQRLHVLAELCDWKWLPEYSDHRRQLGLRGSGCDPSALMLMEDNPDLLRARAQSYASELFGTAELNSTPPAGQRPARLRIGYFFAARDAAAVLDQHGGMLAAHDDGRFDIRIYAVGAGLPDSAAQRFDGLKVLDASATDQMAAAVKADQLDAAVDLSGYSGGGALPLFAARLAPLHILFPGYPGTMGTAAYDYLISDAAACPPGSERYHNEHLLRLAGGHQAVTPSAASASPDRAACGLPAQGFVFSSFASGSHITPQEFDLWMRLLQSAPDSVLWLADNGEHAMSNLRRAAAARGIDPDRLVFAPAASRADHLARLPLADLVLDSFTVNAAAAARDALAAGVPVLTLPGQQSAARTSASLLQAAGLPDMIAESMQDYEAKAAELAADSTTAASLRGKLRTQQQTAALFSPERLARQVERTFDAACERQQQGLAPAHLELE